MCVLIALRQFEATKGIVIALLSVYVWSLCNVNQAFGIKMLINNSINSIYIYFRTYLFDLKSKSYLLTRIIPEKVCTIYHIDTL